MKTPRLEITQADLDYMLIKTSSVISKLLKGKNGISLRELNNGLEIFYEVRVNSANDIHLNKDFEKYENANDYFLQLCRGA